MHPTRFHRLRPGTWIGWVAPPQSSTTAQMQINGRSADWLNVLSGGEGVGAAIADLAKDGGPNQYTYFLGLGEDAVSASVNRALFALGENTDLLDDELNKDQPVPKVGAINIVGAPANNAELGLGDIYTGPVGTSLNVSTLPNYFRVLDTSGDEVVDSATNVPVTVQAITGLPTSLDPPYGNDLPLVFSHALPVGSYLILCAQKKALSTLARGDLLPHRLDAAMRTAGVVQRAFRALRGDALGYLSPWDSNIVCLTRRGLDGVLRNTSVSAALPSGTAIYGYSTSRDTPGGGGAFLRDGAGILGLSRLALNVVTPYCDLSGSVYTAVLEDTGMGDGEGAYEFVAGSRGFTVVAPRLRSINNGNTADTPAIALSSFAAFDSFPDKRSDTTRTPTVLNVPVGVSLQRVSGEDRVTITTGGNFFTQVIATVNRTSLVLGWSMLEIEWVDPSDPFQPNQTVRRLYRVMSLPTSTRALVRAVDGSEAPLPASVRVGTITRVLTPTFMIPSGLAELQAKLAHPQAALLESGSLIAVSLPRTTETVPDEVNPGEGAYFGASDDSSTRIALRWGGYVENLIGGGRYFSYGFLRGDGSIACTNIEANVVTASEVNADNITSAGFCACDVLSANSASLTGNLQCADITADLVTCTGIACTGTASIARVIEAAQQYVQATHNIAVGATQTLNLVSSFSAAMHVRVNITGIDVIFSNVLLPSFPAGSVFLISFHHNGGNAQMGEDAWSSAIHFQDPADSLLSDLSSYIDTFQGVVLPDGSAHMTVHRYSA